MGIEPHALKRPHPQGALSPHQIFNDHCAVMSDAEVRKGKLERNLLDVEGIEIDRDHDDLRLPGLPQHSPTVC
jgi:hypothetical protein